jgi:response regulator RpfG family c-di-GMP phosphodiesterase
MSQPELIYWKGSGDVRSDLLQAIRVVGYRLTTVSDIDDVLKRPAQDLPGLVVVDASAGEAEASQRVIEMSAASAISAVPIIFLSYQATRRSAVLKKTFKTFIPIDIPFRLQNLLEKLLEICPVEKASEAKPPAISLVTGEPLKPAPTVAIPAITKVLIREGDPSKLKETYGGEFFALAEELSRIDDSLLIPAHPKKDELIKALNAMTSASELAGLRARRVAFLSSAIANSLGLSPDVDRNIRVAGMFLNWGLKDALPRYLKHDFLLLNDEKVTMIIGSAFANSAKYVREILSDVEAAAIIEEISKIVLLQSTETDVDAVLRAHCALAPELTDRSAWHEDYWDINGVYRTVRRMEDGSHFSVPPQITRSLSRVLSEASATRLQLDEIPPLPEPNPNPDEEDSDLKAMRDAEDEATKLFATSSQKSIAIADLKPGMKLARPIVGVDGKLILRSNISLTEELIQNIWRITTIRQVRPKVSVLT